MVTGDYAAPKAKGGLSIVGAALSSVLVLGLIWFYFAFAPGSKEIVKEVAAAPVEEMGEGAADVAGDAAAGQAVYAAQCAACHGAQAEGGALGPALAGVAIVKDAAQFAKIVREGTTGGMPPFPQLTDKELADMRAYLLPLGGGAAEKATPAEAAPAPAAVVDPALLAEGEKLYQTSCASCHMPDGSGAAIFPALSKNANLADTARVLDFVLNGKGAMPAYGGQFDDRQVAAVATYIRNSWGNDFGPVSPGEVAAKR